MGEVLHFKVDCLSCKKKYFVEQTDLVRRQFENAPVEETKAYLKHQLNGQVEGQQELF